MTSIYDAIKADHQHHRDLLKRIADTSGNSDKRQSAWRDFYCDVKSHAAAEEETFYSKLMSKTWGQDAARHSVTEHAEMDELMEELNRMDMASSGWLNKFNKLRHDYEHHMDEEENEVFTRARKVIPEEETRNFGDRFRKRKKKELQLVAEKREDHLED
ncbi:MAG: hemerythrin domain-containing protein [Paracoccaceae bacterium]